MTKDQAVKEFKENELPYIIERFGKDDKVAIRTAWNDYTDYLCKEGIITENQYTIWDNPFA